MNLLPKTRAEFSQEDYWNKFFCRRGEETFEWYGEYPQLRKLLQKYIRKTDSILVTGCGNSAMSADLYDAGLHSNISVDISNIVVEQMTKKYCKDRPGLSFQKMDITKMTFDNDQFRVVLDKGTLDALMSDDSKECNQKVDQMFFEIWRVLRIGGRYICISLCQDYLFKKIVYWFLNEGWMIRIHRCFEAEKNTSQSSTPVFPVFMIICTKMRKFPGQNPVIEIALNDNEIAPKRIQNVEEVFESVKFAQNYEFLRHRLTTRKLIGELVSLDLHSDINCHPRYTLYVVDIPESFSLKFAIFIVPQGRETEWMFATLEGRNHLARSAISERLIVVHLSRQHIYRNLDEVKAELSSKVMELAPKSFSSDVQVPFLSIENDVGHREVIYTGSSPFTGDYVIEDVVTDGGQQYRRLIFLNNQNVIQSEARLKEVTIRKKKKISESAKTKKLVVDHDYLGCHHHSFMLAGLAFVEDISETAMLIGLGGGGLASYINQHLPEVKLEVVELDQSIVSIAKDFFGLQISNHLKVHVADGIQHIDDEAQKGHHYNAVLLDVDNKDSTIGLSCPPMQFVESAVLNNICHLISPSGVAIINLACRDEKIRAEVHSAILSSFGSVFHVKVPEEINEILYAMPNKNVTIPDNLEENLTNLLVKLKKHSDLDQDNLFEVSEIMSSLQITR